MGPGGGATEGVITQLHEKLGPGDVVMGGGNSYYKDSKRRAAALAAGGIHFLDIGTSGGIWGRSEGYCMMVGGPKEGVAIVRPILDTLAPANGWAHFGAAGAGHFVKMNYNEVQDGVIVAYGEGVEMRRESGRTLELH